MSSGVCLSLVGGCLGSAGFQDPPWHLCPLVLSPLLPPRPGCSLDDNGVEFPIGQIWSPGDPCELCICQVNDNLRAFSRFPPAARPPSAGGKRRPWSRFPRARITEAQEFSSFL